MAENIFLIGFMGSGKSTIANILNREFHMKRIEMDQQIEMEEKRSISEIFATQGEAYFRTLETELLRNIQPNQNIVVSCGGGVPMREENVRLMKERGRVIYLKATPETIYERVRHSHNRPLLEGNMNVDYIRGMMSKRHPAYESASDEIISVDRTSSADIANKIYKMTGSEE